MTLSIIIIITVTLIITPFSKMALSTITISIMRLSITTFSFTTIKI